MLRKKFPEEEYNGEQRASDRGGQYSTGNEAGQKQKDDGSLISGGGGKLRGLGVLPIE